ncbi:Epoxyqueuosine reductase [Thalassocella blandensis]|nr:Epoxyqueuosine reductase [Thalassocella blandensis]
MTSEAYQSQNIVMAAQNDFTELRNLLNNWAQDLGFQQVGITETGLDEDLVRFREWLAKGYHGSMQWMQENAALREDPSLLVPGAVRVISLRMNYLPDDTHPIKILKSSEKAYISRYSLGRDYHKLIRKRLAQLAKQLEAYCTDNQLFGDAQQRAFVDSAPVLERPYAEKAGLGSTGKHTLIINRDAGSWFFLGEIITNIPLPVDKASKEDLCGECDACLKVCPTDAFPKPYQLDARRCISYLTIENKDAIPLEFREPIGNRVFGCDDCQAICPWNKQAPTTAETDFQPRHELDSSDLLRLFLWSEDEFLKFTEGSAIRRIGYERWLRNLSVGLGNAPKSEKIIEALKMRLASAEGMLHEHFSWALDRQLHFKGMRKRKIKRKP